MCKCLRKSYWMGIFSQSYQFSYTRTRSCDQSSKMRGWDATSKVAQRYFSIAWYTQKKHGHVVMFYSVTFDQHEILLHIYPFCAFHNMMYLHTCMLIINMQFDNSAYRNFCHMTSATTKIYISKISQPRNCVRKTEIWLRKMRQWGLRWASVGKAQRKTIKPNPKLDS